ncbi:hypothetical protein B0H13DRAFT_2322810 [Mycena leptocephala]|nr:hypothetical protein B0H13DRAFT_2322810 [Mycena leptocephala]
MAADILASLNPSEIGSSADEAEGRVLLNLYTDKEDNAIQVLIIGVVDSVITLEGTQLLCLVAPRESCVTTRAMFGDQAVLLDRLMNREVGQRCIVNRQGWVHVADPVIDSMIFVRLIPDTTTVFVQSTNGIATNNYKDISNFSQPNGDVIFKAFAEEVPQMPRPIRTIENGAVVAYNVSMFKADVPVGAGVVYSRLYCLQASDVVRFYHSE